MHGLSEFSQLKNSENNVIGPFECVRSLVRSLARATQILQRHFVLFFSCHRNGTVQVLGLGTQQ